MPCPFLYGVWSDGTGEGGRRVSVPARSGSLVLIEFPDPADDAEEDPDAAADVQDEGQIEQLFGQFEPHDAVPPVRALVDVGDEGALGLAALHGLMDEEQDKMRRTGHNKIFVAPPRNIDLGEFYQQLQELAVAAEHNDDSVVEQLAKMVPTFTPTRENLKL